MSAGEVGVITLPRKRKVLMRVLQIALVSLVLAVSTSFAATARGGGGAIRGGGMAGAVRGGGYAGGAYRGGYGYGGAYRGGYGYGGYGFGLGFGVGIGYPGYYGPAYYNPYYYGPYGYPYPYGYYPPVVGGAVVVAPRIGIGIGGGWRRFGR